ncbi:MAG: GWxTD domain-containing protein [Deltaproteobacteria bacterium]|nr:GWxTD domain-containing protein [Deltaproteobacteria bacterium]
MFSAVLVVSALLWSLAPQEEAVSGGAGWARGPVRWLMLPAEEKQWRKLESEEQFSSFIQGFWTRRSGPGDRGENPKRTAFHKRVAEADLLFEGEGTVGSLTNRGRAYLLLGPPSELVQNYRNSPDLSAGSGSPIRRAGSQRFLEETWSWRPEDLGPDLQKEMSRKRWRVDLVVRFEVAGDRHILRGGEELLRLAARAWVEDSR